LTNETEFSVVLRRIEVHNAAVPEIAHGMTWTINAGGGDDQCTLLIGHLLASAEEIFGQAQVIAMVGARPWPKSVKTKAARADFEHHIEVACAEAMYDTARRALQANAALMDFQFELDVNAPSAVINLEPPTSAPA
jgi:hypothetical protein